MTDIRIEQHTVINKPTCEVFEYLSDCDNLIDWASVVIAVRRLSSRMSCGVGTMVKTTVRFLGQWMDMTFETIECKPNHYLAFKSISGACPSLFYYRLEPSACGGTIIHSEAFFQSVRGIIDQEETVVISALHRQIAYDLCTLKDILEARTPALPG